MSLTIDQRCRIAIWQETSQSVVVVQRQFRNHYGRNIAPPCAKTIHAIHTKFMETGSVCDKPRSGRPASGRSAENIDLVEEAFGLSQTKSLRRAEVELGLTKSTVHRILKLDIRLYPYKIQSAQALLDDDYDRRVECCELLLYHINGDPTFLDNLWWSDECTFHVSGKVNKQNCRIWGNEMPHDRREVERDSPKVNVWCALSQRGIIGPFFFENDAEVAVNVNHHNYLAMLRDFFIPHLTQLADIDDSFFQQDGAPPHFALDVREFLNTTFPERWIGRRGPLEWAPRSPDLTPLDFFLWGHLKTLTYKTAPTGVNDLKQRITRHIHSIGNQVLENVARETSVRLARCIAAGGGHVV